LVGVGTLAFLILGYLLFDWLRRRKAVRRVEHIRRRAQEEWQQQLRQLHAPRDSHTPSPQA